MHRVHARKLHASVVNRFALVPSRARSRKRSYERRTLDFIIERPSASSKEPRRGIAIRDTRKRLAAALTGDNDRLTD